MRTLRIYAVTALKGHDFQFGLGCGGFAGLVALSPDVREAGVTILITQAAIAAGVTATVFGALAIFATFFDSTYRRAIESVPDGMSGALAPYVLIGAVAAFGAIAAMLVAIGWPAFGGLVRGLLLGLTTGLFTWALAGIASLTKLTAFHAEQRAELARGAEQAREIYAERLAAKP